MHKKQNVPNIPKNAIKKFPPVPISTPTPNIIDNIKINKPIIHENLNGVGFNAQDWVNATKSSFNFPIRKDFPLPHLANKPMQIGVFNVGSDKRFAIAEEYKSYPNCVSRSRTLRLEGAAPKSVDKIGRGD